MKRSLENEENCGHWEYEALHAAASPEAGTAEQSSMPRNLGTTTRRLRFSRSLSREYCAGLPILEGVSSRVHEAHGTLQKAQTDVAALGLNERGLNGRTPLREGGRNVNPNGSHGNYNEGVMAAASGVLDTSEDPMFEVYEDRISDAGASTQSLADDSSQSHSSDALRELVSGGGIYNPHPDNFEDDRDKENRDPLGDWDATQRGSPLPEWYPRKPLQDITNVLASGPDDEQPQPKKKCNKKLVLAVAPSLFTLRATPAKKGSGITQSKPFSCVASKQASNLRKNFR